MWTSPCFVSLLGPGQRDRHTHTQFQLDDTPAYTLRELTGEIVLEEWTFLFGFSTTQVFGENEITLF